MTGFKYSCAIQMMLKALCAAGTFAIGCSPFCSVSDQFPFVQTIQYRANDPIEDRTAYAKLNSIPGYTVSVFDGHGGFLLSQFASKNINTYLDTRIKNNIPSKKSLQEIMDKSLTEAYEDVENAFFVIFKDNLNEKAYRRVGTCALTAIILKNSIHIGNAGDCEGLILGYRRFERTNERLNAGEALQKARLAKEFPGEDDIVKCKPSSNYCYVKGRLQPTRSLGDYYLKHKEYNVTNIKNFTGPYIDYRPKVTHFTANLSQKYLLLATDGLWDETNAEDIYMLYQKTKGQSFGKKLLAEALLKITLRTHTTATALEKIQNRRDLHDDITILTVDLEELRKTL